VLTGLTVLARLTLLAVLTLLSLFGPVAHALIERLHAANEIAGLVDRPAGRVLLVGVPERRRRVLDFLLQPFEIGADLSFDTARVLRWAALQRVLRVADHLADPLVGDAARRFI